MQLRLHDFVYARTTTVKTLMGEVPMKRTLYKRTNEDGAPEYVFLLDEALGLDTIGNISPNLVERLLGIRVRCRIAR